MALLSVGDTIQNEITHEEGHIVRIVKVEGRVGYVVALPNKVSGTEFEALWAPQGTTCTRKTHREILRLAIVAVARSRTFATSGAVAY